MLELSSRIERALTHLIGWPLFFVAIYWCITEGGFVAWTGVNIVDNVVQLDHSRPIYTLVVIAAHSASRFILTFFAAGLFSVFLFSSIKTRIVFSLAVSFLCALFVLWLGMNIAMHT